MDQVFSSKQNFKNIQENGKKYWKSQGILSVQKSGNHGLCSVVRTVYCCEAQDWCASFKEHVNGFQAYTSQFISLVMFGLMMCEDRISMQERRRQIIQGLKELPGN